MKKIKHYEVVIVQKEGLMHKEHGFTIEDIEVVHENDYLWCLNTMHYATVAKGSKYESTSHQIDKPSISFNINDKVWGSNIIYNLYTFKSKRPLTIQKEIAKAAEERYGFLANLDLSFIK